MEDEREVKDGCEKRKGEYVNWWTLEEMEGYMKIALSWAEGCHWRDEDDEGSGEGGEEDGGEEEAKQNDMSPSAISHEEPSRKGRRRPYDGHDVVFANEVSVGCVFVDSNTKEVVAGARNETNRYQNATRHCELVAIDRIIRKYGNLNKLLTYDLFVTCEPCVMCTCALQIVGGVRAVIYGCKNYRFGGCGSVYNLHMEMVDTEETTQKQQTVNEGNATKEDNAERISESKREQGDRQESQNGPGGGVCCNLMSPPYCGMKVIGGICEKEAIKLLQNFYMRGNPNAPDEKRKRELVVDEVRSKKRGANQEQQQQHQEQQQTFQ
eukprot:GHVS01106071.1.p1 GENE.GHVS01106071.1~~GHVS01106071.1.p1  ORF type:complete len:323 (-),score=78.94 GHVS01106071.1:607-1575(-)